MLKSKNNMNNKIKRKRKNTAVSYTEGVSYNYKTVKTYEELYEIIKRFKYPVFSECIRQYKPINLYFDIKIKNEKCKTPYENGWDIINRLKQRVNKIFSNFQIKYIVLEAREIKDEICRGWYGRLIVRLYKNGYNYFLKNIIELKELYDKCIKSMNIIEIKEYDLKGYSVRTIHSYIYGDKETPALELCNDAEYSTSNILETFVMFVGENENIEIIRIEEVIDEYIKKTGVHIPRKNRMMYSITEEAIEELKGLEEIKELNVQIILANFMKIKMINAGIFKMDIEGFYKYEDNRKCFVEFNGICPFRNKQHSNSNLYMCTTRENIQLRCFSRNCRHIIYKEKGKFEWMLEILNNMDEMIIKILNRFIKRYIDEKGSLEGSNEKYKMKLNGETLVKNFAKNLPMTILKLIKEEKKSILELNRTNYSVKVEDLIFRDDIFSINYFLLKYSQGWREDRYEKMIVFSEEELSKLPREIEFLRKIVEIDRTNEDVINALYIIIKGDINYYADIIYRRIKDMILYCNENFYICDSNSNIWYRIPSFRYDAYIFNELSLIFENTREYLMNLNFKIYVEKELMRKLYGVIRKKMKSLRNTEIRRKILEILKELLKVEDFEIKMEENMHLVPFLNGVLDIFNNPPLFRDIINKDYIINIINYKYKFNIKNPEVMIFLKSIIPEKSARKYLLGCLAEGLLFNKYGKKIIWWIGDGDYEKYMLYQLVKNTFGDTCKKLSIEFLLKKYNKIKPEAILGMKDSKKKRVAFYFAPENAMISTKVINKLCTGQAMYGKRSIKDKRKIYLNFKLFVIANKSLNFCNYNKKLKNQINVIEFKSKIEKDPKLLEKIRNDETWKQTFMNILVKYLGKNKKIPRYLIDMKENYLKKIEHNISS